MTKPLTKDRFLDYRRGLEKGVMKNPSPNCVRDCLNEIDTLRAEKNYLRTHLSRAREALEKIATDSATFGEFYAKGVVVDFQTFRACQVIARAVLSSL